MAGERIRRTLALPLCWLAFAAAALPALADTAVPTEGDPLTARREHDLAQKLRCLVCQNQTVADSEAELARDLRRQVREQIRAGRSDEQIIAFMTARYGDFVLYEPPLKPATLLLWLGPALLLAGGAVAAARVIQARRRRAHEAPMSEQDHARAQALLDDEPR